MIESSVAHADADRLLKLYRDLGRQRNHIGRFYLHLEPEVYDLELQVEESHAAEYFREELISIYDLWLSELTTEERAEFFTYNDLAGGANTNWLIADEPRLTRHSEDLEWDEQSRRYVPAR